MYPSKELCHLVSFLFLNCCHGYHGLQAPLPRLGAARPTGKGKSWQHEFLQRKSPLQVVILAKNSATNLFVCSSSEKLFKAALLERDLGDQEKAYILFYKYVECVQRIQKHHEYKKDEKYYVSMFNLKKNMRLGIENLETLTTALERRYEEKEAEAVAEKLSKVDIFHSNTDFDVVKFKLSRWLA